MTKRTQIMVLAGMVACAALYGFVQLLFVPMLAELRTARLEIDQVEKELDDIRATVRSRAFLQAQTKNSIAKLRAKVVSIPLPVLGNYMIGMEEAVRTSSQGLNVEIFSIANVGEPAPIDGGCGVFRVFQTRVVAKAGLHELAKLFFNFEKNLPYASISNVTIIPNDDEPERHSVDIIVSWLIWSDPFGLPECLNKPVEKDQR